MMSCKKYTCYCEVILGPNLSVPPASSIGGSSSFSVNGQKTKAKNKCTGHTTQPDSNGYYTKCQIK